MSRMLLMRRMLLWLALPALASDQDPLARGTDLFNQSCATGYCHQLKGAAGGAPRLARRGFDEEYILRVIRMGIPGTTMPGFGNSLSRADLMAVVTYVESLNGITPSTNPALNAGPPSRKLAPQVQRGRDLFFDQVLGFGRCSTCHQEDGWGLAIASPISTVPQSVSALRVLDSPGVDTATVTGDAVGTFPALVVSQGGRQTKVYDLSWPPPVLRIFPKGAILIARGSSWRHASVLASYGDADLEAILAFLREVVHQ